MVILSRDAQVFLTFLLFKKKKRKYIPTLNWKRPVQPRQPVTKLRVYPKNTGNINTTNPPSAMPARNAPRRLIEPLWESLVYVVMG